MNTCKHPQVQNFKFPDGGASPLWSCSDCAHKFVPLNIRMEKDCSRYRWLRMQNWDAGLLAVVADPKEAIKLGHDVPSRERLDEAIDAAMAAERAIGAA